ncbi:hypothetical protein J3F84DRAFT_269165 [Trichoderma pleuroticola]
MGPGDSGPAAPTRANASASASASAKLTEKEAKEIKEYEKIVRFRDAILAGTHPTIKLPPGLTALSQPTINYAKAPSQPGKVDARPGSLQQSARKIQSQNPTLLQPVANARATAIDPQRPKPFPTKTTAINPILLEKSDELVRAEIQLQRQRIERSLRDEIEQRRVSKQVQAEPVNEFDLSDVLAKALTIVQATTIPFAANGGLIANHEAASDSFDDDTFYSSKHDTPESNLTSRVRHSTDDAMLIDGRRPSQSSLHQSTHHGNDTAASTNSCHAAAPPPQPPSQTHAPMANVVASRPEKVRVPGLHTLANGGNAPVTQGPAPTQPDRALQTASQGSENDESQYNPNQPLLPRPPVIRNHDLIPVAPQPAKIAPLTVVNVQTPVVDDSPMTESFGTSAQVPALRNASLPAVASSDSSSQGGRDTERRRGKKKRKADRQAPEAEAGPRIKVEPRSPSPLTAPAYTRPSKRPRQSQGHANESGQTELRYAQPPPNASYEQPLPRFRGEQAPMAYQEPGPAPYLAQPASSSSIRGEPVGELNRNGDFFSGHRRLSGESYARPLPPGESYVRHPQPQPRDMVSYHHPPSREMHGPTAAPQVVAYGSFQEPMRVYREPIDGPRASVRPEGESFIIPPRPPTRVMVDSYGREFVEPVIHSGRQSVAPLPRPGEPEVVYERLPPRLPSSNLGAGAYNEGNVVYTRPLSVYDPARKVYVSEPEYPYDHRDGQYREHSLQQRGYIQIVRSHDGRIIEERPAEYVPRQTSYRPSRLEPVPPFIRMHSTHPDAAGREYNGGIHMDGRHPEGPQPYAREYSYAGSPMQRAPTVHREYSMRPPERERYHEPHRGATRGSDEIAFIERPRGASREIVYVDDAREIYR